MFPNVNGFIWTPLHLIFLGVFFCIATTIAITMLVALWRTRRDVAQGRAAAIAWHSTFEDLPERDRACRHELSGEFRHRHCELGFDCRGCQTHAKLVAVHPVASTDEDNLFGLHYPTDRLYHRGHTWVRHESDGTVTVGLDAIGRAMLGPLEQVQLPAPGTQLQVNGEAWTVRQRGDEFRILSPVEGEVVEVGEPEDDYCLKVRPRGADTHLLRGAEIRPWVMRELERLQMMLSPEPNAPSLADGGVLLDDMPAALPEVNWPSVWGRMLLEP